MAHELPRTFQQTIRIGKLGTSKESHIHVGFEGIDVCKCRVSDARRRMAVMQHFPHIVSTPAHDLKPMPRNFTQLARMLHHPCINGWVSLHRTRESKKLAHLALNFGITIRSPMADRQELRGRPETSSCPHSVQSQVGPG